MTLKMYEIINFPSFYEKIKSLKLPFKTSYRLALLALEVEKHINYYQEQFRSLLNEYGKKDDNGNLVPTDDGQGIRLVEETMEEVYTKISELRNLEVELNGYSFTADDFDGIELSPEEMVVILPFIKE